MTQRQKKIRTRPHRDDAHRRKVRAVKILLMPITVPLYLIYIAYEWFHFKISDPVVARVGDFWDWYISR